MRFERDENGATFTLEPGWPREFVHLTLGFFLRTIVQPAGPAAHPDEITFAFEAPPDRSLYRHVLGIEPSFGAPRHGFRLSASTLRMPHVCARPELWERLRDHAERLCAQARGEQLSSQVRAMLRAHGQGPFPTHADVARSLGISVRTLARRLREEGRPFQSLLDAERSERARSLLENPALTLADVAERVGFADTASFHRAFRRWFGKKPGAWRSDQVR